MNLPTSWQELTSSPLIILALLLTVVTVLFLAIYLIFFFIPKKIPEGLKFIKKHPLRSLILFGLFLVTASIFYAFYYFGQPVRIVTANQFKIEKSKDIKDLQKFGFAAWKSVGLYVLDIRSEDEYSAGHIKGAAGVLNAQQAAEKYPMEDIDIAIYSSASKFNEARRVADAIERNGDLLKENHGKIEFGKIYVIRDGFEGLKAAGFITELADWD